MIKKMAFTILTLFIAQASLSQKAFDITIKLDSSIDPQKITCLYYNGSKTEIEMALPDTIVNNTVKFKGKYYSKFLTFSVRYNPASSLQYISVPFFIGNKPATISFYIKPDNNQALPYSSYLNAYPIDTITNKTYKKLLYYKLKQNATLYSFLQKNGKEIFRNDSITQVFRQLQKVSNAQIMLFLKKHSRSYLSFWYFRDQIINPSSILFKEDTIYLKSLLTFCKSVFPPIYTESAEGKMIIKDLENKISPAMTNAPAPVFHIKDILGNELDLNDFKGRYVLLDFWATWCQPCIAEIPFIKKLRKNNASEKLAIIGISQDYDLSRLKGYVQVHEMNWPQIFDKEKTLTRKYNVYSIPTLILIDPGGKMLYRTKEGVSDGKALSVFLKQAGLNVSAK